MSDVKNPEGDTQITRMLDMRQQLAEQMAAVDRELQILLLKKKRDSFQPLTQLTIQEMVAEHMGQLKVKELTLFADIAPATYYKIINRVEAVKIGTLKALLNTLGLDLFIGQKEQQSGIASHYPNEVKR
jgi:predicted transcriptional regulator